MPSAQLPFADSEASGLEELAGASPSRINVLVDASGAVRVRPGYSTWSYFPTTVPHAAPVIGMYPWQGNLVYITQDTDGTRKLWALNSSGSSLALSDDTAPTQLAGSLRPVFAEGMSQGQQMLVVAGGGTIQKWQGSGLSANLGATSPLYSAQPASHVCALYNRLVADNYGPTGQVQWSGQTSQAADFEQWAIADGSNVLTAEARPDAVLAVRDNTREVFAFGPRSVQVFVPDADTTFSPTRTLSIGTLTPYSIIETDDGFAWLDERRRVIVSNGRDFQPISSPGLAKTFANLTTVSDCWGFRARLDAYDLLVWLFPTEAKGYLYDLTTKRWAEWKSFDLTVGDWVAPSIRSYCYWPEKNAHLVGLADGTIATLDMTSQTEGTNPVIAEVTTGFVDHDTSNRKHCESLRFTVRRGIGTGSVAPVMRYSYRDDLGAFCQPMRIDLGLVGDYGVVKGPRSVGVYRTRQHKVQLGEAAPFVLTDAQETFETMES